jgi:hypothetical protein
MDGTQEEENGIVPKLNAKLSEIGSCPTLRQKPGENVGHPAVHWQLKKYVADNIKKFLISVEYIE